MSKYHKGDKFIVEIKEVMNSDNGTLYRSNFKTLTFDDNGLDKLKKYEELSSDTKEMLEMKAYNKALEDGRNEVWELAKKIASNPSEGGFSIKELIKIFGTSLIKDIFKKYSAQEALAKLEEYEEAQEEIEIGDIVVHLDTKGVILDFIDSTDDEMVVLNENGCVEEWKHSQFKKTGKRIDIQSVLEQIGGAE